MTHDIRLCSGINIDAIVVIILEVEISGQLILTEDTRTTYSTFIRRIDTETTDSALLPHRKKVAVVVVFASTVRSDRNKTLAVDPSTAPTIVGNRVTY